MHKKNQFVAETPQNLIALQMDPEDCTEFIGVVCFEKANLEQTLLRKLEAEFKNNVSELANFLLKDGKGWLSLSENQRLQTSEPVFLTLAEAQSLKISKIYSFDVDNSILRIFDNGTLDKEIKLLKNSHIDQPKKQKTEAKTQEKPAIPSVKLSDASENSFEIEAGALLKALKTAKSLTKDKEPRIFTQEDKLFIAFAEWQNDKYFGYLRLNIQNSKGKLSFIINFRDFIKLIESFSKKENLTITQTEDKLKINNVVFTDFRKSELWHFEDEQFDDSLAISADEFLTIYRKLHISTSQESWAKDFAKGFYVFKTEKGSNWVSTSGPELFVYHTENNISDGFNGVGFRLEFCAKIAHSLKKYKKAKTVQIAITDENGEKASVAKISDDNVKIFLKLNRLTSEFPNYEKTFADWRGDKQWFRIAKDDIKEIVKISKPEFKRYESEEGITFRFTDLELFIEGVFVKIDKGYSIDSALQKPMKVKVFEDSLKQLFEIDTEILQIYYKEGGDKFHTFYVNDDNSEYLFTVKPVE